MQLLLYQSISGNNATFKTRSEVFTVSMEPEVDVLKTRNGAEEANLKLNWLDLEGAFLTKSNI